MLREHETGEAFKRTAACRNCKGHILWVQTPKGKKMPLDAQLIPAAEAVAGGMYWIAVWEDRLGKFVLTTERAPAGVAYVLVSHFATCPGRTDLADAQKAAQKAPYFARLWAANGGPDLSFQQTPGALPSHPNDPAWIHDPPVSAPQTAAVAVSAPQGALPYPTPRPEPSGARAPTAASPPETRMACPESASDLEGWRNVDWRGGVMALLVCAVLFLGCEERVVFTWPEDFDCACTRFEPSRVATHPSAWCICSHELAGPVTSTTGPPDYSRLGRYGGGGPGEPGQPGGVWPPLGGDLPRMAPEYCDGPPGAVCEKLP